MRPTSRVALAALALVALLAAATTTSALPSSSSATASAVLGRFGDGADAVTLLADPATGTLAVRADHANDRDAVSFAALHGAQLRHSALTIPDLSTVPRTVVVLHHMPHVNDAPDARERWHDGVWAGVQLLMAESGSEGTGSSALMDQLDGARGEQFKAVPASIDTDKFDALWVSGSRGLIVALARDDWTVRHPTSGQGIRALDMLAEALPPNTRLHQLPLTAEFAAARARSVHTERAKAHVAHVARRILNGPPRGGDGDGDGDDDTQPDPRLVALLANITTVELQRDVRYLTGEDPMSPLHTRHSLSAGHRQAAAWMKERMEEYGCDSVEYMEFREGYGPNVICTFEGTEIPDEEVVLGSHLDDRGSLFVPFARAPGANDDGSGSAMLLAALRHFSQSSYRNAIKRTVRFISFAGEEQGLIGSRAYARKAAARGDKITFMLQADMLGYHAEGEPMQCALPAAHATFEANLVVGAVAHAYVPEVVVGTTPACCSDHQSFYEAGYVSTQIYERNGPIADPMYHNRGDLSARKGYDFEQVKALAKVALATVISVAEVVEGRM